MLKEDEDTNSDADVTADACKINEYNDNMIISVEDEHNTLEYKGTIKECVENIANKTY